MNNTSQPNRPSIAAVAGRILLGLVPLLLLVAVLETALWALNLGEPPPLATTSRGFDASARYLIPDETTAGAWRTQAFDDPASELTFPPKGDAVRVLLVGGSNTKLLPVDELQRRLSEDSLSAESGRTWEVLNIGRPGYGSERVLIFLKQALVLQPDVVVIYAGHNEFVEATFAQELGRDSADSGLSLKEQAVNSARDLRSFNLLADAFANRGAGGSAWADGDTRQQDAAPGAPEPWAPVVPASFDLDPAQTQRHYDAYERNLEAMCDVAAAAGARVLVCTPLTNMWVSPTKNDPKRWAKHVGLSAAEQKEIGLALRAAKQLVPLRYRELLDSPVHLRVFTWYDAHKEKEALAGMPYEAPELRKLGAPLDKAPAGTGRLAGSVDGAHWPDPLEWGSITRDHMANMALLMKRELTPEERAQLELSAEQYRRIVQMTHEMPAQLFALGTVLWLLGDDEGAATYLQAARDKDPAPRAANTQIHEAIRRVAAARAEVSLLDSARIFAEADPNGLPGYEMMMDGCHMQPGVRVALMHEMAGAIPPLLDN